MIRAIRRIGMALGSLVVAWLVVGFIGGRLLSRLGFIPSNTPMLPGPGAPTILSLAGIAVTLALGWLIYRILMRREQQSTNTIGRS